MQMQTRTDEMEVRRTVTTALIEGAMPSVTRADFSATFFRSLGSRIGLLDSTTKGVEDLARVVPAVVVQHELIYVLR